MISGLVEALRALLFHSLRATYPAAETLQQRRLKCGTAAASTPHYRPLLLLLLLLLLLVLFFIVLRHLFLYL
jgi:MYXO-CTERM domain-containing protein